MRYLLTAICLACALDVPAQTFTEVAAGQVDLGKAFKMTDSCTVTLGSFALSSLVTVAQYQAYLDYFLAMSDSNTFATGHADFRTAVLNGETAMTNVSWTAALAYCDWLAGLPENRGWKFRLPLLSEYILARQAGVVGDSQVGVWLMNAKDESQLKCQGFDYLYPAGQGDSFALRRKMVVRDNSKYSILGTGENYWQDLPYPSVGFRVVRYQ